MVATLRAAEGEGRKESTKVTCSYSAIHSMPSEPLLYDFILSVRASEVYSPILRSFLSGHGGTIGSSFLFFGIFAWGSLPSCSFCFSSAGNAVSVIISWSAC